MGKPGTHMIAHDTRIEIDAEARREGFGGPYAALPVNDSSNTYATSSQGGSVRWQRTQRARSSDGASIGFHAGGGRFTYDRFVDYVRKNPGKGMEQIAAAGKPSGKDPEFAELTTQVYA